MVGGKWQPCADAMKDFDFEKFLAGLTGKPLLAYGQPSIRKSLDRKIVQTLNSHPDGISFAGLAKAIHKTYGKQVLTRSIYLRLLTLVRAGAIRKSGRGKAAKYRTDFPDRF